MASIVTNVATRARARAGRKVRYFPTAAEVTAYGVGPFAALITNTRASGNADLTIEFPAPLAGYGTLDTTFGAPELAALVDVGPSRHKADVPRGGTGGTFAYFGI